MTLRISDPKQWRGRQQLQGKTTTDGKVVYVTGPRIGQWRWDRSKNSLLAKLEADVYDAPLRAHDGVRRMRLELDTSGKFTFKGVGDEMEKVGGIAKPTLDRAKEQLAHAKREVADRWARIRTAAPEGAEDPVRVMRKIQACNVMRGMNRRDLMNVLAGQNPNSLYLEAALEAEPQEIPNMGQALRTHLEGKALQAKFGPEIEELTEFDEVIELASRTLAEAEAGIAREIKGDTAGSLQAGPSFQSIEKKTA